MIRTVAIVSNGDELTSGLTVDTNANHIADRFQALGVETVAVLTVGDRPDRIRWAFERALELADLVVSTGGLGPTADDLTTEVLAATLGLPLHLDEAVAEHIRTLFRSIGREMPENNLRQARFPEGAIVLPNPRGTAAGYRIDVDRNGARRSIVVMPGVPREMRAMVEESLIPWVRERNGIGEVFVRHVFQTFGAAESTLDELLEGVIDPAEATLSFRAAFPQISVRITVRGKPGEAESRLAPLVERVRSRIGEFVFGDGDATMEAVVQECLRERGWTLAVAESCTGGLVAHRLTEVPGSSAILRGALVAYAPETKVSLLGVRSATLETAGTVSEETAREMAEGVRNRFGADVGISTTGIAGPDGGTEETPVGTVSIGLASAGLTLARRYQLWGGRDFVKLLASQIALDWVRRLALDLRPGESLAARIAGRERG